MRVQKATSFLIVLGLSIPSAVGQGKNESPNTETFVYKRIDEVKLEMVVHFPSGWKAEDKRPAIVFFFGGGWTGGKIEQFQSQAAYLAERGMVAARADYRVKSRHGVTPDKCVDDAKNAVRFLRQNAAKLGIDPDRIAAAGGSAGGHLAACTALSEGQDLAGGNPTVSFRPNALILFNPVLRMDGPPLLERVGKDEVLARKISPTLHLAKNSPPTLILFGTADKLLAQGEEFVKRSKELGHRAEMYTAEGQPHGFFNKSPWQERTLLRADEFLGSLGYLTGKATNKLP